MNDWRAGKPLATGRAVSLVNAATYPGIGRTGPGAYKPSVHSQFSGVCGWPRVWLFALAQADATMTELPQISPFQAVSDRCDETGDSMTARHMSNGLAGPGVNTACSASTRCALDVVVPATRCGRRARCASFRWAVARPRVATVFRRRPSLTSKATFLLPFVRWARRPSARRARAAVRRWRVRRQDPRCSGGAGGRAGPSARCRLC